MQFVYKPEGADPKKWPFAPGKLMSPEAEAIERQTGMTLLQWQNAVMEGSMLATRALVYVMLKRTDPTLKWESVSICMDDIDFETDAEETAALIDALEKRAEAGPLTDEEQEALDTARERASETGAPAPKASESSDAASTPDSSPTS